MGESCRVDSLGAGKVGPQRRGEPLLPGTAAVGEPCPEHSMRAGVEAETGRALGRKGKQLLADRVEQRGGSGLACTSRRLDECRCRAMKRDCCDAGRQRPEGLPARKTHLIQDHELQSSGRRKASHGLDDEAIALDAGYRHPLADRGGPPAGIPFAVANANPPDMVVDGQQWVSEPCELHGPFPSEDPDLPGIPRWQVNIVWTVQSSVTP